jgi:hypothetical protein
MHRVPLEPWASCGGTVGGLAAPYDVPLQKLVPSQAPEALAWPFLVGPDDREVSPLIAATECWKGSHARSPPAESRKTQLRSVADDDLFEMSGGCLVWGRHTVQ